MRDYIISSYIDDELNLDEKKEFVEIIHNDKQFKDETIDLLEQEKLLRSELMDAIPEINMPTVPRKKSFNLNFWLPPLGGFATAMVFIATVFILRTPINTNSEELHRFVIYEPDSEQPKIVGSFTNWAPVPMKKIGETGYWEISLKLPSGEYRYNYLIGNNRKIADPTVLEREQDDFGGENSIIRITSI